jgi:hypothetical protein
MHDPTVITFVEPVPPYIARNQLGRTTQLKDADPRVVAALRTKLATAKIDKAIREALGACDVPLFPAQVEYLCGLIQNAGREVQA